MNLTEKLKVKHCVFDFDGTLVDSMPYWKKALDDVLTRHGARFPENVLEITTPMGAAEFCRYAETLGSDTDGASIRSELGEVMLPFYTDVILPKSGAAEKLDELIAAGIGIHVLTASPHGIVDPCLKRNGLYEKFANVWTCDDFGLMKSDPLIYIKAAERIGAEVSAIAFFDDNVIAVTAAAKSGMRAVGVYDETSRVRAREIKSVADAYIMTLGEI